MSDPGRRQGEDEGGGRGEEKGEMLYLTGLRSTGGREVAALMPVLSAVVSAEEAEDGLFFLELL